MRNSVNMENFSDIFLLLILSISIVARGENEGGLAERTRIQFINEYFLRKGIKTVTSFLCRNKDFDFQLTKLFSEKGISYNWMNLSQTLIESNVEELLALKFPRLGLLIDLNCPNAIELLEMASRDNYFIFESSPTFWLILQEEHVENKILMDLAEKYETKKTMNVMEFLMEPYGDQTNDSIYFELNRRLNKNLIEGLEEEEEEEEEREEASSRSDKNKIIKFDRKSDKISKLLKLKILMDNEVTLAIGGSEKNYSVLYNLYGIYKVTSESKPEINLVGIATRDSKSGKFSKIHTREEKRTFGGVILKAGCMIWNPEKFTTLDDLSKREFDIWQKVSYDHIKALSQDLNFRVVIRFFSDYGWEVNGSFTHLLGSFKDGKSLLSATGALMRADRLNVIDYTMCPFRFQVGILFREPSLPSVNNIFILPFSRGIWVSVGLVVSCVMIVMLVRPKLFQLFNFEEDRNKSDFSEVVIYVLGAVCQQGFSISSKAASDRTIIFFLLLTSLILFSSYSACIVALLQSYSSAIASISDLTRSEFQVGVQAHFPFLDVLMKEAKHPVLREYFNKKIINQRNQIYYEPREGIEKMRRGMFAFEADLNGGYNVIRQTFDEQEKCGIKVLDLAPKPYVCFPVVKSSSYKKMFTQRLIWQEEVGLFDRSWKRWMDLKPKCEVNRVGFISVGLTEFHPVLWIFVVGAFAAFILFFLELFFRNRLSYHSS